MLLSSNEFATPLLLSAMKDVPNGNDLRYNARTDLAIKEMTQMFRRLETSQSKNKRKLAFVLTHGHSRHEYDANINPGPAVDDAR